MFDGGLVHSIDVESAIQRCKEVVSDEANIVLDVISLNEKSGKESFTNSKKKAVKEEDWPEVTQALTDHPSV